jgi:hypothetical protein
VSASPTRVVASSPCSPRAATSPCHLPPTSTRASLHARHGCCLPLCAVALLALSCLASLPLLLACLPLRSASASTPLDRRSASAPLREAAVVKPPLPTAAKSRPKQAEAVHHPPLWRLAVDSVPPIPSRFAATSPRWALGLCCSLNRQPSSLMACAAQHRWPTPTQARRLGG